MKTVRCFSSLLRNFDFFPANQLFRYKGEDAYTTATGGVCSIIIIIIFIILFISAGIQTINKRNVVASHEIQHEADPSYSQITVGPGGDFLFAIKIYGLNLTDPSITFFDVTLTQDQFAPIGVLTNRAVISMIPCTANHFTFGNSIQNQYYRFNLSQWLCPPLNQVFQIQGKLTSDIYKQFTITVQKCNTTLHSNCIADATLASIQNNVGYFSFAVALVNTQLNPSSSDVYKNYYIEDRNYFSFSSKMAVRATAQLQQYEIDTDSSILPNTKQNVEMGFICQEVFQHHTQPPASDVYLTMSFKKSTVTTKYIRTFQKLDEFLSYVGGLIGTVMGLIFIVSSYNQLCYLISLSNKLFDYDRETKIKSGDFNFVYYIAFVGYKVAKVFGCFKNCSPMKIYEQCSEEMEKQLDVAYLYKRLILLQRAMTLIIDDNQLTALQLQNKFTIEEAQHFRQKFKLEEKLQKQMNQNKGSHKKQIEITQQICNYKQFGVNLNEPVHKPREYQQQISGSSFQSIKSQSLQSLRKRVKVLLDESKLENSMNQKIMGNANMDLINKIKYYEKQKREVDDRRSNSAFNSSIAGDNYFRQMEEREKEKYRVNWQNSVHKREESKK